MWVALGLFAHNLNLESLIATSSNASFLAIVALGQMLVITTGRGAIDLSIPNVITLSAFLSGGHGLGQRSACHVCRLSRQYHARCPLARCNDRRL